MEQEPGKPMRPQKSIHSTFFSLIIVRLLLRETGQTKILGA